MSHITLQTIAKCYFHTNKTRERPIFTHPQIIHTKELTITELNDSLSSANRKIASDANIPGVLLTTQAKLNTAEDRVTATEERLTAAVRAERSIASHRVATLEWKHQVALQREKDAIAALTALSQTKVYVEKEKAQLHLDTLTVERKANKEQKQDHKKILHDQRVKLKSDQRQQRKELNVSITDLAKKVTKQSKAVTKQSKSAIVQATTLKRIADQRDMAKELASKRQKRVDDRDSEVDSLRDKFEAVQDELQAQLLASQVAADEYSLTTSQLNRELSTKDETISKLQCDIVVSQYFYQYYSTIDSTIAMLLTNALSIHSLTMYRPSNRQSLERFQDRSRVV